MNYEDKKKLRRSNNIKGRLQFLPKQFDMSLNLGKRQATAYGCERANRSVTDPASGGSRDEVRGRI